jgi:hypothetical protein
MSQEIIDRDQIELRLEAENNFIDSLRSIREYQQKQGVAEADLINVDEVYERLSAKD